MRALSMVGTPRCGVRSAQHLRIAGMMSTYSMIKRIGLSLVLLACSTVITRADVTIVQKVEGVGPVAEMTIKIKGDKARIDATPQMTSIVDGKSGEMINLMKDQKVAVRISAEKMKAAAEMVSKFDDKSQKAAAPKSACASRREASPSNPRTWTPSMNFKICSKSWSRPTSAAASAPRPFPCNTRMLRWPREC